MIIKNVCLLLEALSIVFCLHYLYGEKFKLDIATVSFFAVDMIMMQAIDYLGISKVVSIAIYPIIAIYCGVKFGFKWKAIIVNIILSIILIGIIQLIVVFLFTHFWNTTLFGVLKLLLMNCVITLIALFLLLICDIRKLAHYAKDKGKMLMVTIGLCVVIVLRMLIDYKKLGVLDIEPLILLFISIIFIFILSGQLNKYKIKSKEIETELRVQKLYADSFKGMIEDIRLRQHEFNNHISMLHSMHLKYHTFEELAAALDSYGNSVTKENRFHKLLSCGNSVIIGFLYGRFVEFDKKGIEISYQVSVQELEIGVPCYKIVEILGNLMNNAVEALLADQERKKLHVSVIESDRFYIEVRNESPYIPYKEIGAFFVKDYSKKGESRGLGLYNVKQICEEYGLEISCDNVDIDGENWLSFEIRKEGAVGK